MVGKINCKLQSPNTTQAVLFHKKTAAAAARAAAEAAAAATLRALRPAPPSVMTFWRSCQLADRDSSGLLQKSEARAALRAAGVEAGNADVARVLAGMQDNAGLVNYRRLAKALQGAEAAAAAANHAASAMLSAEAPRSRRSSRSGGGAGLGLPARRLVPAGRSVLDGAAAAADAAPASQSSDGASRSGHSSVGQQQRLAEGVDDEGLQETRAPSAHINQRSRQQRPRSAPAKLVALDGSSSLRDAAAAAPTATAATQTAQPQQDAAGDEPSSSAVHPALVNHLTYMFDGGQGCGEAARHWLPGHEPTHDGFGRKPFLGDGRPLNPAALVALAAATAPDSWRRASRGREWLLSAELGRPSGDDGRGWAGAAVEATVAAEAGSVSGGGGGGCSETLCQPAASLGAGVPPEKPAWVSSSRRCSSTQPAGATAAAAVRPASAAASSRRGVAGLICGSTNAPPTRRPASACVRSGSGAGVSGRSSSAAATQGAAVSWGSGGGRGASCQVGLSEARREVEMAASDLVAVRCLR